MARFIKSILKSAWDGVANNAELRKLLARYPRFFGFLRKRLSPDEKFGLYLTMGAIITIGFMFLFFGVVEDLIGHDPLIQADLRVINLVQIFRTPSFNNVMLFITYLGKWQIVAFGLIATLILLGLQRRRHYAIALLTSVLGGEFFVWLLKTIIARPRPPLVNALVPETSFSFPSGHSFVALSFYGLLAYFAFREAKTTAVKIISVSVALLLVLTIGFSRIYLGVHWPSDVLASYAAGAAWLAALITALEIRRKFGNHEYRSPYLSGRSLALLGTALFFLWVLYLGYFFKSHPLPPVHAAEEAKILLVKQDVPGKLFVSLPRTSEDISGKPMEPINIIIVGTQEQLARSFESAGWRLADGITPKTFWHLVVASVLNEPYPEAPGTPSFWNAEPNDFSYEKPAPANSVRARHHVHFWETPFIVNGGAHIWFATAHFDRAIEFSKSLGLPTHTIDPAVDKERDNIKNDLIRTNTVSEFKEFQITEPALGSNQSGDQFFTDGKSYILFLKN